MLNDSSEPFEYTFNTLDFPVGVHSIGRTAFYDDDGILVEVGGSFPVYFEHQDRSLEQTLYAGISIALVSISIAVVAYIIYRILRERSRRAPDSRFMSE
jgi:hypothetical protein